MLLAINRGFSLTMGFMAIMNALQENKINTEAFLNIEKLVCIVLSRFGCLRAIECCLLQLGSPRIVSARLVLHYT